MNDRTVTWLGSRLRLFHDEEDAEIKYSSSVPGIMPVQQCPLPCLVPVKSRDTDESSSCFKFWAMPVARYNASETGWIAPALYRDHYTAVWYIFGKLSTRQSSPAANSRTTFTVYRFPVKQSSSENRRRASSENRRRGCHTSCNLLL